MPGDHAYLSPSAAERWMQCPASVRLAAQVPEQPDSVYAAEGTCAHELGEIKVRYAFGQISESGYKARRAKWHKTWNVTDRQEFEMDSYTDAYVDLVTERAALYPNTQVLVEQRLDTGVPTCWGTSDIVLASPSHIEVIDLKYGAGVHVDAQDNPQLRLYALGALDTYGDMLGDTETVRITVFQPRKDNTCTEVVTPLELREWRTSILPVAAEALSENARFGPSESACRWCPASGNCRAQLASVFVDIEPAPDDLSEAELAQAYAKVGAIEDWAAAIKAEAFNRAYNQGKKLPGYKVVLSGGKRSIPDPEAAIEHLEGLGYNRDEVSTTKLRGLGELETLMGKTGFAEKMKDFVLPAQGKPALAPEDDKRPSINPAEQAAKDFEGLL